MSEVFSLDDVMAADGGTVFTTVNAYGGVVRLGSLSSAEMIDWLESNDDKIKQKFAGLRLLVKSIVDADGNRISEAQRESALVRFQNKDGQHNGRVIAACMKLNGLHRPQAMIDALKNDSGEASTDASPTASA